MRADSPTPRETECIKLCGAGMTNERIASELHIHPDTVKNLLGRAYVRLGCHDRTEAVVACLSRGYLTLEEIPE